MELKSWHINLKNNKCQSYENEINNINKNFKIYTKILKPAKLLVKKITIAVKIIYDILTEKIFNVPFSGLYYNLTIFNLD